MQLYRVFPHLPRAAADEPGHPLFVHPDQGLGRWDNPDLYRVLYVAASVEGAIGETFAHLSRWSRAMLPFPAIAGSVRTLGVYSIDETAHPLLDLDDSKALLDRGLRPTDVVKRDRRRTQQIAREAYLEGLWSGLSWWSIHQPNWVLHALWKVDRVTSEAVQDIPSHPGLREAGRRLAKNIDADIS